MKIRVSPSGPDYTGNEGDVLVCQGGDEWAVVSPNAVSNVVCEKNGDPYSHVAGDPSIIIISASITIKQNSRIKVEAAASVVGSVAAGRCFIFTDLVASTVGSQSFDAGTGENFRTMNLLGVTDALAEGEHLVEIRLDINGDAGATINGAGTTTISLTELPN